MPPFNFGCSSSVVRETTAAPLIKAAIARCQVTYGSSCDSRWIVIRLAAFDSVGWIEELVVRCADRGVTLSGARGLAGAAVNDFAVVNIAQYDADRLVLRRDAHEMDAWWLSDLLLLDGRTFNFGAVRLFVKHHNKVTDFPAASCVRLGTWLSRVDIFSGC